MFSAERISRSSTFPLRGRIEVVFPLFGPVLEKKWAEGWDPDIIFPAGGILEKGMVFKTRGNSDGEDHYTWIVSALDTRDYLVEYTVFTPCRVWVISVRCRAFEDGTMVSVQYTYTATSEAGNELNRKALREMFVHDLRDWQEAINYYLVRMELTETPKQ